MITPQDIAQEKRSLGQKVAALRQAAGYRQEDLARELFVSRSSVANTEVGRQVSARDFWIRCDQLLRAGGELIQAYERLRRVEAEHRRNSAGGAGSSVAALADDDGSILSRKTAPPALLKVADYARAPRSTGTYGPESSIFTAYVTNPANPSNGEQVLIAPPGRFFNGAAIDARFFPAIDDGRILASVPINYANDALLSTSRRTLIIGVIERSGGVRAFGMDDRAARRQLTGGDPNARLLMPGAYALDDLSLGMLWAVSNLDAALLNDDAILAELQGQLTPYQGMSQSSVSMDLAPELTTISKMWVGSDFCARHILRHVKECADPPDFWTREQRGEEASAWLFFRHKYEYLEAVSEYFGKARLRRTFCVPPDAVAASPAAERILLCLTGALMESFGIQVEVNAEPEYAAVDGFVLDREKRAIVANWIGAAGIWHAALTTERPRISAYRDALGYTQAHSVVAADTPGGRLRALADYLDLKWPWLVHRCAELADHGSEGLVRPRSRLLSNAGVDRACRYLGGLTTTLR